MLHKLRDTEAALISLQSALRELVNYWRDLRPQVHFVLTLTDPSPVLGTAEQTALLRGAQEKITNDIRRGTPTCITITPACDHHQVTRRHR
jgi:signal transduction histidine kinase